MPTLINGRQLGVAENGIFTAKNTDPIPGGKLWPEAALTWNFMVADFIGDGGDPGHFVPNGSRSSAREIDDQVFFWNHQPPPAARVWWDGSKWIGTSNHGWGIAVDVKTQIAAAWIMRHGLKYGWSWDEGQRAGEWWHFRYVGTPSTQIKRRMKRAHALDGYTESEKRWIREFDKLRKKHPHAHRVEVLKRVMTAQRKRIWQVAQPKKKGGDGHGWTKLRTKRYNSLKWRTT